jgi:hypothetical protein
MKRNHKFTVVKIVAVVLFLFCLFWVIFPLTRPIAGVQLSRDELVEWIKRQNTIVLVNPVTIIKDRNGSYYDWASAEIAMRRNVSVGLWFAVIVLLGLWAARRTHSKDIQNNPVQGPRQTDSIV